MACLLAPSELASLQSPVAPLNMNARHSAAFRVQACAQTDMLLERNVRLLIRVQDSLLILLLLNIVVGRRSRIPGMQAVWNVNKYNMLYNSMVLKGPVSTELQFFVGNVP